MKSARKPHSLSFLGQFDVSTSVQLHAFCNLVQCFLSRTFVRDRSWVYEKRDGLTNRQLSVVGLNVGCSWAVADFLFSVTRRPM